MATYRSDDTRVCVMQFWPPDYEHMCSKHVEAWNKLIVKQKFCATSWLITEIKIFQCSEQSDINISTYRVVSGQMSDVCRKSFHHLSALKIRKSSVTGNRPYSCDMCKKSFSRKSTLFQHECTHAGENPYSCGVCVCVIKYFTTWMLWRCMRLYTQWKASVALWSVW